MLSSSALCGMWIRPTLDGLLARLNVLVITRWRRLNFSDEEGKCVSCVQRGTIEKEARSAHGCCIEISSSGIYKLPLSSRSRPFHGVNDLEHVASSRAAAHTDSSHRDCQFFREPGAWEMREASESIPVALVDLPMICHPRSEILMRTPLACFPNYRC